MTSKKVQQYADTGMWADYGAPEDDYWASVYEDATCGWRIAYYKRGQYLSSLACGDLDELEQEMRKVQPDLRKWHIVNIG